MKATKRLLVGRTITGVSFNVFRTAVGQGKTTDPTIFLDNGARLRFLAIETEIGEYGIEISYWPKRKGTAR